jgi:hypothetical protein
VKIADLVHANHQDLAGLQEPWRRSTTSPRPAARPFTLDGCDSTHQLIDLLHGGTEYAVDDRGRAEVELDGYGYGYRWLRLMSRDSRRLA